MNDAFPLQNVVQGVLTANSCSRGRSEGVNIYCIRCSSALTACFHCGEKKDEDRNGARATSPEAAVL